MISAARKNDAIAEIKSYRFNVARVKPVQHAGDVRRIRIYLRTVYGANTLIQNDEIYDASALGQI